MRHLGRTHRVSVDWLHEQFMSDNIVLLYEKTDRQAGDIFTKGFTNPDKWRHAAELVNILPPDLLKAISRDGAQPGISFQVPPQVAVSGDVPEQSGDRVSLVAPRPAGGVSVPSGTVPVGRASCMADLVGCTSRTADRGPSPASSLTASADFALHGLAPNDRRLVEICCSNNSVLGQDGPNTHGCERIRVTKEQDILTQSGCKFTLDACAYPNVMIWASLECKGASPMNHFNWVIGTANTRNKIGYHISKFATMFAVVRAAAKVARRFKGTIAFELPSTSLYWKTPLLLEFIRDHNLCLVDFHGCCFNLRVAHGPNAGMLALKPWRVATKHSRNRRKLVGGGLSMMNVSLLVVPCLKKLTKHPPLGPPL
jgi:hypothetical protein